MSRPLKLLLMAVNTTAIIVVLAAVTLSKMPGAFGGWAGIAYWTTLTLLAQAFPVRMPRGTVVSVAIAPDFGSRGRGGHPAAAIVAGVGLTEWRELRGDVPWYGTLYNHAESVIPAVLAAHVDNVPAELRSLPLYLPILRALQERAHSWDVLALSGGGPALSILQPLQPECLVPSLGREGELLGLAVLGPRLSEEPYSGEDKRLLDLVANQAGTALENIRMAEKWRRHSKPSTAPRRRWTLPVKCRASCCPRNRLPCRPSTNRGHMHPGASRRWRLLRLPQYRRRPRRLGSC